MKQLPLPARFWEQILDFLARGESGRIELDVKDGKVIRLTIAKSWRHKEVA